MPAHPAARRWYASNTFRGDAVAADLAAMRDGRTISVAIPTQDEADTVGAICRTIVRELMEDVPLVDELVVLDGGSEDGTQQEARATGATVVDVRAILPAYPAVPGKGDAMWRGLSVLSGDLVVFVDGDIRNFGSHFVCRLAAPILAREDLAFVKAFYRRPLVRGSVAIPDEGGRVTELTARPLLNALFPELGGVVQPLAGEYAARRDLLERLPFVSGYGVEVALLIDLLGEVGLSAIAQADLGERVHRNRPLRDLARMAAAISRTILARAERSARIVATTDYPDAPVLLPDADGIGEEPLVMVERPPLASLGSRARKRT